MFNYCTKCGREIKSETGVCNDCSTQAQPQIQKEKQTMPFAEPPRNTDFFENQTTPLIETPTDRGIQPTGFQQGMQQQNSHCPYCGGAGGIYTKSEISTAGFIYLAIMLTLTFLVLFIFFPCAIVPFALIFLVFLFKEKHFACVNCGQKLN